MVLHLSCGQPPHPWDSKAASEVMDIGPCYAADKIALICSDAKGKDDFSLSIPASI